MQIMLLYDLLEPYAVKAARTVLRREGTSNSSDLSDFGKGGTLVDFGIAYHHCSISEFLQILDRFVSFHQPLEILRENSTGQSSSKDQEKKIIVLSVGLILSPALLWYLHHRKIPEKMAQAFCDEVQYKLYNKYYYAIGFKTDGGGYELRNSGFKGSSKPKCIKFIDRGFCEIEVFEGFFSFLSFLTVINSWKNVSSNFLILNSLSLFKKSQELMERHDITPAS